MGNAIKFTERGSVRVVARSVYRQEHLDLLQVDVIDTGIGLSADQIDKLFKPFSQADTSMARKHGGTGLGLAISQRLAEMLGGQISVESEPDRGSTFSLTFETGDMVGLVDKSMERASNSAAQGAHEPAEKADNGDARLDGCRILLAEDGPDNQRLIALLLKRAGAEVRIAENGEEAYTQAHAAHTEGKPFDAILMDMQMPEMDGYEATRRLRSEGYSAPIIALTAHAMDGDEEKCYDAGCNGYLTKPIDHATFLPAIAGMTPTTPDRATSRGSH